MTQTRKILLVLLTAVALLTGLALGRGPASDVSSQPQAQAFALQAQIHQMGLPDPAFTGMVLGYNTEIDYATAERLAGIAVDTICPQLVKGFTYASIRAGLEDVYGFSHGEAGLLISATRLYECS